MDKFIELSIKDFRAVKKADIALNGITVVTGINGCGKSSISKILYYTLKYANDYKVLAREYLRERLSPVENFPNIFLQEIRKFSKEFSVSTHFPYTLPEIVPDDKDGFLSGMKEMGTELLKIYRQQHSAQAQVSEKRITSILSSTLTAGKVDNFADALTLLYKEIEEIFSYSSWLMQRRPYGLLKFKLEEVLGGDIENVSLTEYGEQLIGEGVEVTPIPHFVQKVMYVDTPMIVGVEGAWKDPFHWKDLNRLLSVVPKQEVKKGLAELIKTEILHGDISVDETDVFKRYEFRYTRSDGKQFNLTECATGIKSFSILQLLIRNGFMDENTLVILDEPEAHLHPQWVVEYARMAVMIHKTIGTKFFIASHSTDMVSAIRYIAEKEQCLEPLSFYVAEEDADDPNQYIYKDLKTNIEPIFESFNKSFDKIEQYGESKGYGTEEDLL